jgi:hypothetical protein
MVALLEQYRALWEAMRAHVCLEARAGELGAQIGALRAQAQHASDEQKRLDGIAQRLVALRQAEQGDVKCAAAWAPARAAQRVQTGSIKQASRPVLV